MHKYIEEMKTDKQKLEQTISEAINAYCIKYPIVSNIDVDFDCGMDVSGTRYQMAIARISLKV